MVRRVSSGYGIGSRGDVSRGRGVPWSERERAVEGGGILLVVVGGWWLVVTCLGFEEELKKVEESTRNNRTPEQTSCALNNPLQRHYHSHLSPSTPLKPFLCYLTHTIKSKVLDRAQCKSKTKQTLLVVTC